MSERKPVAWMAVSFGVPVQATTDEPTAIRWRKAGGEVAPLYTRPEPLTDERIAGILRKASERAGFVVIEAGEPSIYMLDVVRLVEAALWGDGE